MPRFCSRRTSSVLLTLLALFLVGTVVVLSTVKAYFSIDRRAYILPFELGTYDEIRYYAGEGGAAGRGRGRMGSSGAWLKGTVGGVVDGVRGKLPSAWASDGAAAAVAGSSKYPSSSPSSSSSGSSGPAAGADGGALETLDEAAAAVAAAGLQRVEEAWNASSPSPPDKIPRIIHQTWKDATIPEKWRPVAEECRAMHPDYEYMLWTDASAREFVAEHYAWFLPVFDNYPYPIQRADAIRYFILHHYGGIYMDLDIGCLRRFDPLLRFEVVLPKTIPVGVSNDVMMSVKGHPFMDQLVHDLVTFNHQYLTNYPTVMFSTGPMFVSASYGLYVQSHGPFGPSTAAEPDHGFYGIRVLPKSLYGKNAKPGEAPDAFFKHFYGSSWHANDADFLIFLRKHGRLLMFLGACVVVYGATRSLLPKLLPKLLGVRKVDARGHYTALAAAPGGWGGNAASRHGAGSGSTDSTSFGFEASPPPPPPPPPRPGSSLEHSIGSAVGGWISLPIGRDFLADGLANLRRVSRRPGNSARTPDPRLPAAHFPTSILMTARGANGGGSGRRKSSRRAEGSDGGSSSVSVRVDADDETTTETEGTRDSPTSSVGPSLAGGVGGGASKTLRTLRVAAPRPQRPPMFELRDDEERGLGDDTTEEEVASNGGASNGSSGGGGGVGHGGRAESPFVPAAAASSYSTLLAWAGSPFGGSGGASSHRLRAAGSPSDGERRASSSSPAATRSREWGAGGSRGARRSGGGGGGAEVGREGGGGGTLYLPAYYVHGDHHSDGATDSAFGLGRGPSPLGRGHPGGSRASTPLSGTFGGGGGGGNNGGGGVGGGVHSLGQWASTLVPSSWRASSPFEAVGLGRGDGGGRRAGRDDDDDDNDEGEGGGGRDWAARAAERPRSSTRRARSEAGQGGGGRREQSIDIESLARAADVASGSPETFGHGRAVGTPRGVGVARGSAATGGTAVVDMTGVRQSDATTAWGSARAPPPPPPPPPAASSSQLHSPVSPTSMSSSSSSSYSSSSAVALAVEAVDPPSYETSVGLRGVGLGGGGGGGGLGGLATTAMPMGTAVRRVSDVDSTDVGGGGGGGPTTTAYGWSGATGEGGALGAKDKAD